MSSFYHFTFDSHPRANSPYTPLFPPISPNFPSHPDTASLIYGYSLATQLRVALLARLLPLAHDLLVRARCCLGCRQLAAAGPVLFQ